MKLVRAILLLLIIQSCTGSNNKPDELPTKRADSIIAESSAPQQQSAATPSPSESNPKINVMETTGGCGGLLILDPMNLKFEIRNSRPSKDSGSVMLSVAAAYTSPAITIEGVFIVDGKTINQALKKTSGSVVLQPDGAFRFLAPTELNDGVINDAKLNKAHLFQQTLLIKDKSAYPCMLPNNACNKKHMRRALGELDSRLVLVQTKDKVTMTDFQKCMMDAGVVNAIYLDMGTWSEGWYRDTTGLPVTIGENMINTKLQTNWLMLVPNK